jgi:protein ImuB
MTCVCLSSFGTPTGAASAAELGALLLERAPRVRVEQKSRRAEEQSLPARPPARLPALIWADARGLHARSLADALLGILRAQGCTAPRAGVSHAPVAAMVAACFGDPAASIVEIPPGAERDYLAPFPVEVLDPASDLALLLDGVGIERCGELADLAREDVEVRFGPEAVALWRLARADDRRLLFGPAPRGLPHAALEWTDYELRDTERLLFVINRLAGSVTGSLRELGQGAREFTLTFMLARGGVVEHPFHPSRATADQRTWIRLIRHALERERLPDLVSGVALRVDAVFPSESLQGDLLDRGFGTAREAEAAMARVLDQGAMLVAPKSNRHPLLRRRSEWMPQESSLVWARPQIGPGSVEPELVLHLLLEPEPVEVETTDRRGFAAPVRYRDKEGWHKLVAASGPDCVSGGRWEGEPAYAWELYCCIGADGELVQLGRDAQSGIWSIHGSWR